MRKFLRYSAAGLLVWSMALPISGLASTETNTTRVSKQGEQLKHIARPKSGDSKKLVAQKFGEPVRKEVGVGEPPISVWHYDNFSVYFEHNRAIHTVLKKK